MWPNITLKSMAEAGYIMGLPTIGQVANHMRSHHHAYFTLDKTYGQQIDEFESMVESHHESSIFLWLTDADKARMDDELEQAMEKGPDAATMLGLT